MADLYDFKDYNSYLRETLGTTGDLRGIRSRLAKSLGCGTAFVSQVVHGDAHLSLEYAVKVSEFLGHDELEAHYFLLLVQLGRAGSTKLQNYFERQLEMIRVKRENISERVGTSNTLNEVDQMSYYSAWYYAAVHVLVSIPTMQSKQDIANALGISAQLVTDAISFLETSGLIARTERGWKQSTKRIHLSKNSPMLGRHHSNWRVKALQAIQEVNSDAEALHFSGAWSFAKKDVVKIRKLLLEAIEKAEPILRDSPEETAYGIGIDFYRLLKMNP